MTRPDLAFSRDGSIATPTSTPGFVGENDDQAGNALATGDIDGDGTPDLIIGGPGDDEGALDAGRAWIVAGQNIR